MEKLCGNGFLAKQRKFYLEEEKRGEHLKTAGKLSRLFLNVSGKAAIASLADEFLPHSQWQKFHGFLRCRGYVPEPR